MVSMGLDGSGEGKEVGDGKGGRGRRGGGQGKEEEENVPRHDPVLWQVIQKVACHFA